MVDAFIGRYKVETRENFEGFMKGNGECHDDGEKEKKFLIKKNIINFFNLLN